MRSPCIFFITRQPSTFPSRARAQRSKRSAAEEAAAPASCGLVSHASPASDWSKPRAGPPPAPPSPRMDRPRRRGCSGPAPRPREGGRAGGSAQLSVTGAARQAGARWLPPRWLVLASLSPPVGKSGPPKPRPPPPLPRPPPSRLGCRPSRPPVVSNPQKGARRVPAAAAAVTAAAAGQTMFRRILQRVRVKPSF